MACIRSRNNFFFFFEIIGNHAAKPSVTGLSGTGKTPDCLRLLQKTHSLDSNSGFGDPEPHALGDILVELNVRNIKKK